MQSHGGSDEHRAQLGAHLGQWVSETGSDSYRYFYSPGRKMWASATTAKTPELITKFKVVNVE